MVALNQPQQDNDQLTCLIPFSTLRFLFSYSRETPYRFKRDLFQALANGQQRVEVDSLNNLLVNIGRTDQLLSEEELASLLQQARETSSSNATTTTTTDRSIATSIMMQLV